MIRTTVVHVFAVLAIAVAPTLAFAQSEAPPHVPLQKSIGQARPEVVPSLIVMNADGATLDAGTLTLKGVSANSIVFADRPVRAAGHSLTSTLLDEWNPSYPDSFAANPPNATVSVFGDDEKTIRDAVVVLKNPRMQGPDLLFDAEVLEGSLADANGPAAVFIDIIGLPFTPLSFAGMARRAAYRSAWYGAAAHPYYPPAPYYRPAPYYPPYPAPYRPPYCGYPPYPPCY